MPPLTDVVGHLLATRPLQVRTKRGDVVAVPVEDVVALRVLGAAPVRTSAIRNIEHAAARAWPGAESEWLDGWLLRAAGGHGRRSNSAVPLLLSAQRGDLAAIVDWYWTRALPAWLYVPDRLMRLPAGASPTPETQVMVCDIESSRRQATASISARPDNEWMRRYGRQMTADVLSRVLDGQVAFATVGDAAAGRAAATTAPDGTRWLGLSAVRTGEDHRHRGEVQVLCSALLDWGAERGATRAYAQVRTGDAAAAALFELLGFTVHHRSRYVDATTLR